MCGRYSIKLDGVADERLQLIIAALERKCPGACKAGEICPGDMAPGVIALGERIVPVPAVFGWKMAGDSRPLINARAETAATKAAFRDALAGARICLPATGFFEWEHADGKAIKYHFNARQADVMYLCGLYRYVEAESAFRFVILTRAANDSMIDIHDRMPVIIDETRVRAYLTDADAAARIIADAAPALDRALA